MRSESTEHLSFANFDLQRISPHNDCALCLATLDGRRMEAKLNDRLHLVQVLSQLSALPDNSSESHHQGSCKTWMCQKSHSRVSCTMDDAGCFHVIRLGPKPSECVMSVIVKSTVARCEVSNYGNYITRVQQADFPRIATTICDVSVVGLEMQSRLLWNCNGAIIVQRRNARFWPQKLEQDLDGDPIGPTVFLHDGLGRRAAALLLLPLLFLLLLSFFSPFPPLSPSLPRVSPTQLSERTCSVACLAAR